MITITILGLDPYLLKQLSRELTKQLVEVYECGEDGIDFFAPEGLLIHNGIDQTSWNIEIRVNAPLKVKALEKQAFEVIKGGLGNFCINAVVIFNYYSIDNRYEIIRDEYPRYMDECNPYYKDESSSNCDDDCCCGDDCECDHEDGCHCGHCDQDDEEPYLGNAFEDFEKRMGNNNE